jgi:hypothetical protein
MNKLYQVTIFILALFLCMSCAKETVCDTVQGDWVLVE